MAKISLPYKLQIFLPDVLRHELKALAYEHHTTLQTLVTASLRLVTKGGTVDIPAALAEAVAELERPRS